MSSLVPRVYQTVGSAVLRSKAANGIGGSGETYGRVLDVVMDSSHPQYNNLGKSQALYGVFYQKLYKNNDISRPDRDLNFAYCGHANIRKIPVKNEIVSLISDIRADTSEEYGKIKSERVYWKDIIPVWNSPHANLYPDTVSAKTINSKYFVEQGDIRPLKMCEGDLAVEGRFGNTIRLGGTCSGDSPVAVPSANGKPYMILRVGQKGSITEEDTVYEDVNKDETSVYLLSSHKVDLKQANDKRKAWRGGKGPLKANVYVGSQLMANSDRIFLNARKNDIELSAKEEVGVNAKLVALDGEEYVAFDANKIYLGQAAFHEIEPVLLGQTSTDWMQQLCQTLATWIEAMSNTTQPMQLPAQAAVAAAILPTIQMLGSTSKLKTLHSKKSFVE